MSSLDLSIVLKRVANSSDDKLRQELRLLPSSIPDGKFHAAFSAYGATKLLADLKDDVFSGGFPVPSDALVGIRQTSVVLLRLYVSLVYMRSEQLERGLDSVSDQSELSAFRSLYRSGCTKRNEDTLPQHIRNALCHGTVEFLESGNIRVVDREFDVEIPASQMSELCMHVFRYYCLAYEATKLS